MHLAEETRVAPLRMTGVAGGWFALINGSLFPDSVLGMRLSIDLIIAPIVGRRDISRRLRSPALRPRARR